MALVLLVMAGVLAAHVFGLKLFEMSKTKLGASDDARAAVSYMVSEIRAAKLIRIGSGDASSFTEVGGGHAPARQRDPGVSDDGHQLVCSLLSRH